jgi:hypothetical protein
MTIAPAQALENLARLAEAHLLNGPDRRTINQSIATLDALVKAQAATAATSPPAKPPDPAP